MADPSDSPLAVSFELLDRTAVEIEDWWIDSAYLVATDAFEFTYYHNDHALLRGLQMQPVELIVQGLVQMQGRVERVTRGERGFSVRCEGRDFMADLVECNVDPTLSVKEGDLLADVLLNAMSPCGISTVFDEGDGDLRARRSGINPNNVRQKKHKKKKQGDYKPRPAEGVFEYSNRLATRNGCTIQPGPNRTSVVLEAPDFVQAPIAYLNRTIDGESNNIVSGVAVEDFTRVPSFTLAQGVMAKTGEKSIRIERAYDTAGVVNALAGGLPGTGIERVSEALVSGRVKPSEAAELGLGQVYRLLLVRDDEARDQDQIDFSASRALADRLKDTLEYNVTVKGHKDPVTGAVWTVNTMVSVNDEVADISESLWVAQRRLMFSKGEGATTQMRLWRPGTFPIEGK